MCADLFDFMLLVCKCIRSLHGISRSAVCVVSTVTHLNTQRVTWPKAITAATSCKPVPLYCPSHSVVTDLPAWKMKRTPSCFCPLSFCTHYALYTWA